MKIKTLIERLEELYTSDNLQVVTDDNLLCIYNENDSNDENWEYLNIAPRE